MMRGLKDRCIDLIYLDPPFNSDHNYAAPIGSKAAGAAFKDTWTLSDIDEAWWGDVAEQNDGLYKMLDASGQVGGKSVKSYLIYMGVRMIEMHRILGQTGSLYLHCDPTMSHYLKMILDAIFGTDGFRNEIVWKRHSSHNDGRRYGRITDSIFFYTKTKKYTWNKVYIPYSKEYEDKAFKCRDNVGLFQHQPMTADSLKGGGYRYTFHGHNRVWQYPKKSMLKLEADGRVYFPRNNGVPRRKIYRDESPGVPMQNIWTDILKVQKNESLGYPTQKPLALLERIIKCSSDQGHIVLDPFCGCATACLAAERLGRKWVGIDISAKAYDLINARLRGEERFMSAQIGADFVIHRDDIPRRAGTRSKTIKNTLYGRQEGRCSGCRKHFEYRNLEVDHIVPKSVGGHDDDSNLQLLCGHCNRVKGRKLDNAGLRSRLREMGII